jgi:hypothetical protein
MRELARGRRGPSGNALDSHGGLLGIKVDV